MIQFNNKIAPPKKQDRLIVQDLSIAFDIGGREALAVEKASFSVAPGETLALVGESGCGKA